MNYKISGAIRRTRKYFIIFAILWLFISIVLVMPVTIAIHEAQVQNDITAGFDGLVNSMQHIFQSFGTLFTEGIFLQYLKNIGLFTIIYAILIVIGLIK